MIPDSLLNFRYKLTPKFELNSSADVTFNSLSGEFENALISSAGWQLLSSISVSEKVYRTGNRTEKTKLFANTFSKVVRPGLQTRVLVADRRQVSRAALAAGGFQDFVLNNQSLQGVTSYTSPTTRWYGMDAELTGVVKNDEFAFKKDRGQGGKLNGGVRYQLLDGAIRVKVRGSYNEMSEESSSILTKFDGLSTQDDSLLTQVDVNVSDSLKVGLNWTDYSYERIFADQSREATGAQLVGAQNLFRETERREYRRYGVDVETTPLSTLSLKMAATHSEQISDYVKTPTRYSRIVTDFLSGDVGYTVFWGTQATLRLENRETLRDLGPQSVSSYDEEHKRASLNLVHNFTTTFRADVTMAQSITQSFYVDFEESPRDRDQLDSSIKATVTSVPFKKIRTKLYMSITNTEFVNIHQSQSENNRTRLRYDFSPEIAYTMSENVSIEQGYGLAIEFTDFDFKEDENFLDRNVKFFNRVRHKVTKDLSTEFYYSLTLHDKGTYLPIEPGGERFLEVDREDRTDEARMSFSYSLNTHLALEGRYNYSHRRDESVSTGRETITENGLIEGGVVGQYAWEAKSNLSFTLKRTERFSPTVTAEQEKYWVANLAFTYNF